MCLSESCIYLIPGVKAINHPAPPFLSPSLIIAQHQSCTTSTPTTYTVLYF